MYRFSQAFSQGRICSAWSVSTTLKTGRGGVAVDAATNAPGLNAPCMTWYTALSVNDTMMSVSEAHSRYEPLPSNNLRPFTRDAMFSESPMTFFITLLWCGARWCPTLTMAKARCSPKRILIQCSMVSDPCDGRDSTSDRRNCRAANVRDLQQQQ